MSSSNKKLLIFGGSGLVGSSVVKQATRSLFDIFYPTRKELNLNKFDDVKNFIRDISPDYIIHCAGKVGGIAINFDNQYEFFTENFEIGKNIINASIENNVSNIINLGSSCMYPTNILDRKITENDILKGPLELTNEGYALAKLAILKLCEYSNKKNGSHFKTFIPCNLYGPNDKFDLYSSHLIPAIINKVHDAKEKNNKQIEIWGTGNVRREFMFSEDLADFILYSIKHWEKIPEVVNVGMGKDISVNEYYKIISKILGWTGEFYYNEKKPDGMKNKLMDTKIIDQLGWKPKIDLKTGVRLTYDYYKKILVTSN